MLKELRNLLLLCLLCAPLASSQAVTGTYPFGTYDSKGIDSINIGNLNAHITIPIVQRAGRGMPFSYALAYDSSVWQIAWSGGSEYWEPVQNWGWLGQTVVDTGYLSYSMQTYVCDWPPPKRGSYYVYSNWVYHDAYGGSHTFAGAYMEYDPTGCDSTVTGFTAQTSDDAALTLTTSSLHGNPAGGSNILTNPSGLKITAPINNQATGSTITDTNGNQISINSSGTYTDTTGVNAMSVVQSPGSPTTFTYPTPTGTATYTMKYQTYNIQTNFGCGSPAEYSASGVSLVSEIDLPDSSKYTFTYEETTPGISSPVTGRIASITLPTGGTIAYTYSGGSNGIECSDGSTAGLTRTLSNDPAGATWSYVRTVGSGTSETVVSDKSSNQTDYKFVLAGGQPGEYYETNRAVYQGTVGGSTPLLQRETCYNGTSPSSCVASAFSMPISQVDTYETLNGIEMNGATSYYNSNGLKTEHDVYDYGTSSSRGSVLEIQKWKYGYSIPSDVTEDDLYDGSSNQIGMSVYVYDNVGTTASTGVPQHISVSGPRGNLNLMESAYNSSDALTMNASYEDTGSPVSVSTQNGTTNYSYDSTWTYQTGTTLPTPSSGVTLTESASYDSTNSGVFQSATDPNSQTTSVSSYDLLLRPLEVDYPDGGKTTYAYSIYGSNPAQVGVHRYQTSSTYADAEAQIDGYGRASRAETANGQSGNGWYQQDVCYDADGNVNFTSYVYQGAGFLSNSKRCSSSGDSATYDALGRPLTIVRSNGETVTYSYNGRAAKAADQNGVTRIVQIDGLGRTTTVCEISSNSSMPGSGSPTSCGTDISGTGFITSFIYNLASHQTTITQGVQTRTFQTDWLGRTTSVTEPETGTTTYSYAYNSTGLVVSRVRPKANQSSPSVQTTTTTQYDSLGRVVSISYTDGTPTKTFAYDASAGSAWSDLTQSNLKGNLSLASVSNAGSAYSYDAMGRATYLDSCLPSGCGTTTYNRLQHYAYGLAGDLLTSTDGSSGTPVQSTYSVSLAGELQSLTSSLNNSTNPGSLISSVQNGPNGPASWSLGNGLAGSYSYDSLGRLSGGSITNGGSTVYNFTSGWSGSQLKSSSDSTVPGQSATYGYDEFNRLSTRTTTGTVLNYSYTYDRWGNRTAQTITAGGSGPQTSVSINTSTNQISSGGFSYDAAGNMTNDGYHSYTYDADGNITAVDGTTDTYVYNALNQRVSSIVSGTTTEYVFNANGKRVSEWNGSGHAQLKGKYYWGGQPVAYYVPSSAAHFEHQDWLGTERVRTSYNGSVENSYTSLPFGDAQTPAANGTDANHFAALDHDAESYTDHAQFRQYSNTQGRWLSPDPYAGSYDFSNPQSLNRYVYALNNPLGLIDPSGLDYCSISSLNSPDPYYNQYGEEEDLNDQASCEAAGGQWFVTNPATPCPDGQAPDENGNCYTVNPDGSISGGSISAYVDGDDGSFTIVAGIVTYQPGDPVGVGGGSFGTAPNNYTKLQNLSVLDPNYDLKKVIYTRCKDSAGDRVTTSMRNGAISGAATGAVFGFVSGEVTTGEISFGATGPVGAYIGAHLGGVMGTIQGLDLGLLYAGACALAGAY